MYTQKYITQIQITHYLEKNGLDFIGISGKRFDVSLVNDQEQGELIEFFIFILITNEKLE